MAPAIRGNGPRQRSIFASDLYKMYRESSNSPSAAGSADHPRVNSVRGTRHASVSTVIDLNLTPNPPGAAESP
jgi:hypothetical protein